MFYKVKSNIGHDGKSYVPGDSIDLTPEQAASMPWAVEEIRVEPIEEIQHAVAPLKMEASPTIQDQPATDQEAAPAPSIKSKTRKKAEVK